MVDVMLVLMLLVAGLTLGEGDTDTAAEPLRYPAAADGKADSTPCTTLSPRLRNLSSQDAVANPNRDQGQGDPDGI
ncbi:hypothetical protein CWI75_07990 [Kineobactrum sediminis]|uniref:Uncharacterized protein n=1 Tax=Kineobactrum sediminis TaxID=1905677 RepID=A0A2N5Y4K8_9GAMM|nr:hypothetical protein [Kineobactrum sediminis]PLW83330.1 hypothetical protein CWI75_07990 [Kineobactrum sediminis]